jgi:dihydrodiol dehydrogenase / D-xylose 1-dehydrogenase (NADP)
MSKRMLRQTRDYNVSWIFLYITVKKLLIYHTKLIGMEQKINWGIIGCGSIARSFIQALSVVKDARLVAVASKSCEKASEFAVKYKIPKHYDSYEALVSDPEIDVIYIANTHNFHKESAILCLKHKKAVLCEKPITINVKETEEVINIARQENVFLMEAMWTRFHPSIIKIKELIAKGLIGKVQMLKADFGICTRFGTDGRHLNPELAGGALLDVGIYPITMANLVFGKHPALIKSTAYIGNTGVDEISSYLFAYDTGETAMLTSAINLYMPPVATIFGTKGRIEVPDFFHAQKLVIHLNGEKEKTLDFPFMSNGYEYEIMEVMECLRKGKTESAIMPLTESLQIMKTMDTLRAQWGLKYPGE